MMHLSAHRLIVHACAGVLGAVLIAITPALANGAELVIVQQQAAQAVIVLPDTPDASEVTAANELAHYIHLATGAKLTIQPEGQTPAGRRLLVGRTRQAQTLLGDGVLQTLADDELLLRRVGDDLILTGGSPRGTLYAAYTFLADELGVRWFNWWGHEDVPRRQTLSVGALDRRSAPAFAVRDLVVHIHANMPRPMLRQFIVRNRMQGPELHYTGDMSAHGGASHRYINPPHMVHTLFWFMPPDEHFVDHPEYYSYSASQKKRLPRQLCFSNQAMRQVMTRKILERLDQAGGVGNLSISAQDVSGPLCECPDCLATIKKHGAYGSPLFAYLAEVGQVVAERHPQAFLTTLAYRKEQTEAPPRHLKLPSNVIVIFAPIDDDFSKSLRHASNRGTTSHLRGWRQVAHHLWVWYYPYPYSGGYPIGNLRKLHEDFQVFKEVGVDGFFIEQDATGTLDSQLMVDLQTWLIGQFMWDPGQDRQALIADFTDRFYGPAADDIRQYLDLMEDATSQSPGRMVWNAPLSQYRHLSADLLVKADQRLATALTRTQEDTAFHLRVRQARLSVDKAIIDLWDQKNLSRHFPQGLPAVIARYRQSYAHSIQATVPLANRRDHLLAEMNERMDWLEKKTPLKPLPAPLADVPASRVHQFTPEQAHREGDKPILVVDAHAASGIAVEYECVADLPFNMGYYDAVSKHQHHADVPLKDIVPGTYRLHRIGQTALSDHGYVWFSRTWRLQFRGLPALFRTQQPDKQWEIWASIRFDPELHQDAQGNPRRKFRVDRVILVER